MRKQTVTKNGYQSFNLGDDATKMVSAREYLAHQFDVAWNQMAELGKCDALGGYEYLRVYEYYMQSTTMEGVMRFIENMANQPAVGGGVNLANLERLAGD